jgi:hypothetical protein
VARGQILFDAPEVVIPFMVPDGAHSYPDAARTAAEHTMFTVAAGAAVQALLVALAVREVGSCWIGSTIFAADLVRDALELPDDWEPLGAIAIGYPADPPPARSRSRRAICWWSSDRSRVGDRPADRVAVLRGAGRAAPCRAGVPAGAAGCLRRSLCARAHHRVGAGRRTRRSVLLTLHPRLGRWVQLGGHCEDADTGIVAPPCARPPRSPASRACASTRTSVPSTCIR